MAVLVSPVFRSVQLMDSEWYIADQIGRFVPNA